MAILAGSRLRVVEAVKAWLAPAGITEGPLFRPGAKGGRVPDEPLAAEGVANIVKSDAKLAGLEPAEFAGHSLRAGFLTSAAEHGAEIFKMMEVSRHKERGCAEELRAPGGALQGARGSAVPLRVWRVR